MNETELLHATLDMAGTFGWHSAHFRPCQTKRGWRTAVQGDGAGFPDLFLVHPERRLFVFRELKTDRGKLEPRQEQWATWLADAGADIDLWRPRHWESMVHYLSGGRARTMIHRP